MEIVTKQTHRLMEMSLLVGDQETASDKKKTQNKKNLIQLAKAKKLIYWFP